MKKFISIILALAIACATTACSASVSQSDISSGLGLMANLLGTVQFSTSNTESDAYTIDLGDSLVYIGVTRGSTVKVKKDSKGNVTLSFDLKLTTTQKTSQQTVSEIEDIVKGMVGKDVSVSYKGTNTNTSNLKFDIVFKA
jgi:uncharacterized lipoprotein YehR (DUF1307 family)